MATPQNLRSFLWLAESYDSGSGNTRQIIWPPNGPVQATQVAQPNITSYGFTVPYVPSWAISGSFSTYSYAGYNGETLIRSRTESFWITFICQLNVLGSSTTINVPLAPLGLWFVPQNLISITSIVGGNTFQPTYLAPSTTNQLSIDVLNWQ